MILRSVGYAPLSARLVQHLASPGKSIISFRAVLSGQYMFVAVPLCCALLCYHPPYTSHITVPVRFIRGLDSLDRDASTFAGTSG